MEQKRLHRRAFYLHPGLRSGRGLLGVIQRLRRRDATFEQPWPWLGMANRDSTLRRRPSRASHFLASNQHTNCHFQDRYRLPQKWRATFRPFEVVFHYLGIRWRSFDDRGLRIPLINQPSSSPWPAAANYLFTPLTLSSTILFLSIIVGAMINAALYPRITSGPIDWSCGT